MNAVSNRLSKSRVWLAAAVMAVCGSGVQAAQWQGVVGAESPDRGSQALAYLPNELWVHTGDSIRFVFATHESHTVTFLTSTQTRPPGFGPVFNVPVGCPGLTPDGSSFDGTKCVTSGVLSPDDTLGAAGVPTYTVTFSATGNFKFECLLHPDMTGVVHVMNPSANLPHNQDFYDRQAQRDAALLISAANRLQSLGPPAEQDLTQGNAVAAGIGVIMTTTGYGSQTASLMKFVRDTIVVHVGDTVEFTNMDPSINHTVTFGTEPLDPRPPTTTLPPAPDGARQAVINSTSDRVNSGFLSPTAQDRIGLTPANIGATRFRVTFNAPGTFPFICAIHDELGMKGTVIVQ